MSARSMMTLERLRQLIAAYGADPRRWPDDERDSAEAFVAGSAIARDAMAQARELDSVLGMASGDVPDAAMARLTAATAFPPARTASPTRSAAGGWLANLASAFWPRATVFASMAVLGIIVGLAIEPIYSSSDANAMVVGDFNSDVVEGLGL
jgi:hypothetical protein